MGIKRYKGYAIKKEIDNNSINNRNRNINYICLLLILANLSLLSEYLNISSEVNKPKESIPVIEKGESNNSRVDEVYKINFISEGIDIISGNYKEKITDFKLSEDQLFISYKDEEGVLIQDIDKIIDTSSILKITDIELLQDSNIGVRMVRENE